MSNITLPCDNMYFYSKVFVCLDICSNSKHSIELPASMYFSGVLNIVCVLFWVYCKPLGIRIYYLNTRIKHSSNYSSPIRICLRQSLRSNFSFGRLFEATIRESMIP